MRPRVLGHVMHPMNLMLGVYAIKRNLISKIITVTPATRNGGATLENLTKEEVPFQYLGNVT